MTKSVQVDEQITVIHSGEPCMATVTKLYNNWFEYQRQATQEGFDAGSLPDDGEGVSWLRGWDPENFPVLRAAFHLSDRTQAPGAAYTMAAAAMFNVPYGAVTHEQRQRAKEMTISASYGRSPEKIAESLDVPLSDIEAGLAVLVASYPGKPLPP